MQQEIQSKEMVETEVNGIIHIVIAFDSLYHVIEQHNEEYL